MPSCTLFWDVILGGYHEILRWKFIIIYFFNWQTEKKKLFLTNKNFVYLNITTNFCPKITSENIVLTAWKDLNSRFAMKTYPKCPPEPKFIKITSTRIHFKSAIEKIVQKFTIIHDSAEFPSKFFFQLYEWTLQPEN